MEPSGGRTTWVEVSRGALEKNFAEVAAHASTAVCAVVKANAYGCGLVECAMTFHRAGARMIAVTRTEEARALRDAGVAADLLLLAPPPPAQLAEAFAMRCAVTLSDGADVDAYAAAARTAGKPGRVHLKVDTGMGRLGVQPDHAAGVAGRIASSDELSLDGIWTHFADAASPSGRRQLERFMTVRATLGRHAPRAIMHAANSAATIALPGSRLDMVRVGTLLYGQSPPGAAAPFALADPFAWYATVVAVRDVRPGSSIGYGSEWRAKQPARVATLAIGFADGYALEPAARTESMVQAVRVGGRVAAVALGRRPTSRFVWFGAHKAPVVGRVAMQEVTVQVDGIRDVGVGSVARIPARRLLVGSHIERVFTP